MPFLLKVQFWQFFYFAPGGF